MRLSDKDKILGGEDNKYSFGRLFVTIIMQKYKMFIATILCYVMLSTSGTAMAQSLQDKIGTDKIAHFGAGYIIADQLKRHTKMSALERTLTIATLATIKEATDSKFDTKDIVATMLGTTFFQISGKF